MSKKVLIVGIKGDISGKLRDALAEKGIMVSVACNGEEGLWRSVSERPDAIVMDARLPYLNGWDACAEIKRNPETRDIPVIILTSQASTRDRARAMLVHGAACFPKSVDPTHCVELIESLV